MINIDQIKQLREETGASPTECKKALIEAKENTEKAKELLRIWGKSVAVKKVTRETKKGLIDAYIHPASQSGVLLDIRCESDFVAKSEEFKKLAHEICLQIAAMKPIFVKEDDIPEEFLDGEQKIYKEQFSAKGGSASGGKDSGKPQKIVDQIIEGKLKKYKEEVSLLSQPWIKDDTKTIKNLVEEAIAKMGENIEIKRFSRYEI